LAPTLAFSIAAPFALVSSLVRCRWASTTRTPGPGAKAS
jgi:hypothetical protein